MCVCMREREHLVLLYGGEVGKEGWSRRKRRVGVCENALGWFFL